MTPKRKRVRKPGAFRDMDGYKVAVCVVGEDGPRMLSVWGGFLYTDETRAFATWLRRALAWQRDGER